MHGTALLQKCTTRTRKRPTCIRKRALYNTQKKQKKLLLLSPLFLRLRRKTDPIRSCHTKVIPLCDMTFLHTYLHTHTHIDSHTATHTATYTATQTATDPIRWTRGELSFARQFVFSWRRAAVARCPSVPALWDRLCVCVCVCANE